MKALFSILLFVAMSILGTEAKADDLCEAHGFGGNTVEEAEQSCLKNGDYYTRASCNKDVKCIEGVMVCTSREFKGSTMTLAIDACHELGYIFSREECAQDVSCK